jgi:hypothetical protein
VTRSSNAAPRLLSRRPRDTGDEGIALFITLMAMLVAVALGVLVAGAVLAQAGPTAFTGKDVRTVNAAEAGFDAALAKIRAARVQQNGVWVGDKSKLPCATVAGDTTLTGVVGGSGKPAYSVIIRYYSSDPAGRSDTWRDDPLNKIKCVPPSGGPVTQPKFALLVSSGSSDAVAHLADSVGNRTIESVYDFQLSNANVSGGLIHNSKDGSAGVVDLCLDAGSIAPAPGTPVKVQNCSAGSAKQTFAWRSDFSIVLVTTAGANLNQGMCITADATNNSNAYFATCDGSFKQKWGYSDGGNLFSRPGSPGTTAAYYLRIANANTPGSNVTVTTSNSGVESVIRWSPEARAGAGSVGNAGDSQSDVVDKKLQWVNYEEFGRCYDITNWNTGASSNILYPCKQDPGNYVGWNQTIVWESVTQMLYTYATSSGKTFDEAKAANGGKYCMTSPATTGGYVRMYGCSTTNVLQKWTVNRSTGDYATNYTIVDNQGRCLGNGVSTGYGSDGQWSNPVIEVCVPGDPGQKWNAPPNVLDSSTRDTLEKEQ